MDRTATNNTALLRRFVTAFNTRNWEEFADLLTEDVVNHEREGTLQGVDEIIELNKRFHEKYPHATIRIADSVASADRIAAVEHVTADGLEAWGILYGRIEEQQFAELWITGGW